ncbi:MAG: PIN domain-containing protein, partial [Gammaproteobacteria bacterium]
MLGIDTNVLVRLLIVDDQLQSQRAQRLIQQAVQRNQVVWVSLLVLIETEWVLRSRYGLGKPETLKILVA